jgi:hypothetical protein
MNSGSFASAEAVPSAARSKFMPLVTKKNGIRKPKPTAVSFDSKISSSCPRSALRTIMPATNPPSRMSSPRSLARTARPKISTTARRTASCELLSSVRSITGHPSAA